MEHNRTISEAGSSASVGLHIVLRLIAAPALFIKRSALEFVEINGLYLAAAIAYYSFMSIFPLVLVLLWVSRRWIGIAEFDQRLVEGIEGVIPVMTAAGGSSFIAEFIQRAAETNSVLTLFSLVGLLLGAMGVFGAIRKSMNEIWGVEQYRPLLHQRVIDLFLMIAGSCVLFLSLMMAIVFSFIEPIMDFMFPDADHLSPILIAAIRWGVPISLTWGAITVIYSWLPNVEVGLSEVALVAAITTVAVEVVQFGFIFYLQQVAPSLISFYGSLSTMMFFFYFVYAQSIVLLLGAMFAAKRTLRNRSRASLAGIASEPSDEHAVIDHPDRVSVSLTRSRQLGNAAT